MLGVLVLFLGVTALATVVETVAAPRRLLARRHLHDAGLVHTLLLAAGAWAVASALFTLLGLLDDGVLSAAGLGAVVGGGATCGAEIAWRLRGRPLPTNA